MKTCPYCGSHIDKVDEEYCYCSFCYMKLDIKIVKENSERLDVRFRDFVLDSDVHRTTPELMLFSTFELLCLLKKIRKDRTDMFHHMNVLHKASQAGNQDFIEAEKEIGGDYLFFTKKAFVIENIIRSRLGYVPNRITENYLVRYMENIKNDQKTDPMIIRTQRQKK